MSIAALTLGMYHSQATYSTRLVLIAIANFEGENGAYPSHETIGRLAGGLNRRTVQRAIDDLVEMGELTEIRREGITNLYKVAIACPDECDRTTNHRLKLGGGVQTAGGAQTAGGSGVQTAGGAVSRPPEPLDNRKDNRQREPDEFETFWKQYPRGEGKASAEKAYRKALGKISHADLMVALQRYKAHNTKHQIIFAHASTWLYQERWSDEYDVLVTEVREKAKATSDEYLAFQREQEKLAAPPPKCPHGENVALCRSCLQQ